MKNLIFSCAVAVLLGSMAGCKQEAAAPSNVAVQTPTQPADPNKPETPDPNKCYEGEVVYTDCPSYIWVSVKNGNIGTDTRYPYQEGSGVILKNTIAISNSHIVRTILPNEEWNNYEEWKNVTKVYFKLDTQNKNFYSCLARIGCPGLSGSTLPKNVFCATSISLTKCN
jgi:hypothetical protein